MKKLVITSIGLAISLSSVMAGGQELQSPPVSAETCPVPLQALASPPGAQNVKPVLGCIGKKAIPFNAPESLTLRQTSTYAALYTQAQKQAAQSGKQLIGTGAQLSFNGVGQHVSISFAFSGVGGQTNVGSIGGEVLVDSAGKIVVVGVSTTIGIEHPSAPSAAVDATPSAKAALKAAQDFAVDTAFSNILDESSSVRVLPKGENSEQYIFTATAFNPGMGNCQIEIQVSKELGMAFQTQKPLPCQNIENSELELK